MTLAVRSILVVALFMLIGAKPSAAVRSMKEPEIRKLKKSSKEECVPIGASPAPSTGKSKGKGKGSKGSSAQPVSIGMDVCMN